MQVRINRVTPLQAAKVAAALYFVLSIPLIALMIFATLASPSANHPAMAFYVALPFLYALFGFIFSALGAWIYNLVARQLGGFEFELIEQQEA